MKFKKNLEGLKEFEQFGEVQETNIINGLNYCILKLHQSTFLEGRLFLNLITKDWVTIPLLNCIEY